LNLFDDFISKFNTHRDNSGEPGMRAQTSPDELSFSAIYTPANLNLMSDRKLDRSLVVLNEALESQPHTSIGRSQTSPVSPPFSAMNSPVCLGLRGIREVILDEYDTLESQPPCTEPSIIYGKLVITVTDTGAGLSESNQV
jgi:hypothetical protein